MSEIKKKKPKYYGPWLSFVLACTLVCLIALLWSLFISGPARLHEEQLQAAYAKIQKQVPDIKGLEQNIFEYVTYSGYTTENVYWFNQKCEEIAVRDLSTLDYAKVRQVAKEEYGIDAETIDLTFGYSAPCYEVRGKNTLLLLNYDTLENVYERKE